MIGSGGVGFGWLFEMPSDDLISDITIYKQGDKRGLQRPRFFLSNTRNNFFHFFIYFVNYLKFKK